MDIYSNRFINPGPLRSMDSLVDSQCTSPPSLKKDLLEGRTWMYRGMECEGDERRHRHFLVSENIAQLVAVSYRSPSLRRDGSDERRPYLQDNILRLVNSSTSAYVSDVLVFTRP